MEKLLDEFLNDLSGDRGLSNNTIESYGRDVRQFISYLDKNKISIYSVTKTNIIAYLIYLQKNGKATSSISRSLASLRSFFQYLVRNNYVEKDPTLNLESPKVEKKLPEILTIDEVELLLNQPNCDEPKGSRDRCMLELLYATGIRVSELVALNIDDINIELGFIMCRGKGMKDRVIPIGRMAQEALSNYIYKYRLILIKDENEKALFVNLHGKRLTRQGFWKILKRHAVICNLSKKISPHNLRHTFATHLLKNDVDIETLLCSTLNRKWSRFKICAGNAWTL
jgi:integrase/recombinase XerD